MTTENVHGAKSVWVSVFERKGGDGDYTRVFERLEISQQGFLLSKVTLSELEFPVIGGVRDEANWIILTTKRVVWSDDSEQIVLSIDSINDAIANFEELRLAQRTKTDLNQLQVLTMNGEKYTITVEPNKPLIGIWNVLKNVGSRNRNLLRKQS